MKRVRFAPSPTGYLHVGNIRIALINYLFAKKHNAEFFLRIDDTDFKRSKQEYVDGILEDLTWLDIKTDKTFRQSDRLDRYNAVQNQLIDKGILYPCYETEEELETKRKIQLASGKPPVYVKASKADIERCIHEGRKPHYRFELPHEEVKWNDHIQGEVHFPKQTMSDPILIREDGSYLYTFTSVVDDIDYDITHIFRGKDHISNTAVQICILKAVCELADKPFQMEFGHTSFLLDQKGGPLSKRNQDISIRALREQNIHPMTIISYLFHAGTPHSIKPQYTLEECLDEFHIKNYGGASPKFSTDELKILNAKLYHGAPYDWVSKNTTLTPEQWDIVKFNIGTAEDIQQWEAILSSDFKFEVLDKDYAKEAFALLPTSLNWKEWFQAIKEKTGRKGKEAVMPLRLILTGKEHGPEMQELITLLGREKIVKRLNSV
ncbi:MAG: glutamate--tRNA ligase [Alphaproteobacteria bacterium]|nr:MAG: glutamate--tRNA ligase [Alphaproteobacteria bacterium]